MNKILLILSIFLFSCDDFAKKVKENNSNSNSNDTVNSLLSSSLVMNSETGEKVSSQSPMPEFNFEKDLHDFGQLIDGEKVSYSFKFTNSGNAPLIITNAKGSCGCTVPNWPKEPIMSGESGVIQVNYDEKRVGSFNKSITITSNAKNSPQIIKVKGKILATEKKNTQPIKKQSTLAPVAK